MSEWDDYISEVNQHIISTLLKEKKVTQSEITKIVEDYIDKSELNEKKIEKRCRGCSSDE